MNQIKFTAILLAGASALAFPALASAQAAAAPATSEVGEIVVTGSRIIRNGNASPTPVTVLVAQDLQTVQPGTIADNLNSLPVFSGSRTQYGNPNPAGGNGAANLLNLRNLGSQRNLVLFDGHRVPPTLTNGSVDVDAIPQMLIQRVDVVTGGVSAVYGSDAISGVVNFITDRNFNGIKVQASRGISQEGDGEQRNLGVAFGWKVGDRGHFEGSYEYRDDEGVLYRSQRDWNKQWAAVGLGTTAFPYQVRPNVRLAQSSFGGLITSAGPLNGLTFKQNGVLSPFIHGEATGSAGVEVGGDGAFYDDSLKAPLKSQQAFGRFDYDLTDNIHAYVVGSAVFKKNAQYLSPIQLANVRLSANNPYLATAYRNQLTAAGQTSFTLSEFMEFNAPRRTVRTDADQFFVNGGLEGKFDGFDWGVSYTHGWTEQKTTNQHNVNLGRLAAALDAVTNPATGQIVCNVTLTNPGLFPGCLPLNVFGPTASNPAAVDYVQGDTVGTGHNIMDDLEGEVSFQPFSTWAGPVGVALSGQWRKLTYREESTAPNSVVLNCIGLAANCTAGSPVWQNSAAVMQQVSQTVKEAAAEIDVPLLKDVAFAQSFSLNGAARYTSYSTKGTYWTWKVGADWHLNDDLRFRATISRDIRAPTLNELFSPQAIGTMQSTDRLTGLAPRVPLYSGGNPDLTAEIGKTKTLGVIWRPSFAPQFSLTVDGYYIKVENALSSVIGTVAAAQDACYASGGSSPYCELQIRPNGYTDRSPANAVQGWRTININIAEAKAYGLDVEANYAGELFGRRFTARGHVNWEPHLLFVTPGLSKLDQAGVAFSTNALYPTPAVAATAIFHYEVTSKFSVDVLERWRSPLTMKNEASQVWKDPEVPSVAYTNLNLSYIVAKDPQLQVYLNIQNLFDKEPPPAAFFSAQTQPGQFGGWAIGDDPIGRYFTVGVRFRH